VNGGRVSSRSLVSFDRPPGHAVEVASGMTGLGGPGIKTLELPNLAAIARVYQLGVSLPDAPLQVFRTLSAGLPRSTEAERLAVQREVFHKSLLAHWNHRCAMSGVTEPSLLRASHIVPWAECDDDAHRLDVHNGLLLSVVANSLADDTRPPNLRMAGERPRCPRPGRSFCTPVSRSLDWRLMFDELGLGTFGLLHLTNVFPFLCTARSPASAVVAADGIDDGR
jgi:hypothetical protein